MFGPDIPPEVQNVYVENMRKQSYEQGLGRHSESEINELGLGDLEAISHFLGTLQTMQLNVRLNGNPKYLMQSVFTYFFKNIFGGH